MPGEASWQWRQLASLFGQPDAHFQFSPHRLVRDSDAWAADETFLREVLLTAFERRRFQTEVINAMPLYPTEAVLWDENQVPSTHYTGGDYQCMAGLHVLMDTGRDPHLQDILHMWRPKCFVALHASLSVSLMGPMACGQHTSVHSKLDPPVDAPPSNTSGGESSSGSKPSAAMAAVVAAAAKLSYSVPACCPLLGRS